MPAKGKGPSNSMPFDRNWRHDRGLESNATTGSCCSFTIFSPSPRKSRTRRSYRSGYKMVHDGPIRKWLCRLCVEANRLPASVDKEVSNVVYVAGNESWLSRIFDSNAVYSSITANIGHLYYIARVALRFGSDLFKTRISKPSPRNSPRTQLSCQCVCNSQQPYN